MASERQQEIPDQGSEVAKFYHGKSIFITGAAGFLGLVLLETLLRCCPGIVRIYILLRPKKGMQPEDRKNAIFEKNELLQKLRERNPDALNKVIVFSGDVVHDDLGMSRCDIQKVAREVSIVFHCAATISFMKPIRFIINQNVIGTKNVIDMCRNLTKLEAFVYTSTAYSNCNQNSKIEEKIYNLPFEPQEVINLTRIGDENGLNKLFLGCIPPFPNSYTFSKRVAENLILQEAKDIPACIVRPSIIASCLKGPLPGYVTKGSAIVNLCEGVGKGFIRMLPMKKDMKMELIPADVVANAHILAAYYLGTKRVPSVHVINCVANECKTMGNMVKELTEMAKKNPLPKSYIRPDVTFCSNTWLYSLLSMIFHYIPAAIFDLLMWMSGQKFRLTKMYQIYDKTMESVMPFVTNVWSFQNENFTSLSKNLNAVDNEMFSIDLKDFTFKEIARTLPMGCPLYKKNNKPYKENLMETIMRNTLTYLLNASIWGSIVSVFYIAYIKI